MTAFGKLRSFKQAAGRAYRNAVARRRTAHSARRQAAQTAAWITTQRRIGVRIDPSVRFTGLPPEDHVVIGEGTEVAFGVELYAGANCLPEPTIRIGREAYIGQFSNLGAYQTITIGDDVLIAPFCHILSGNHRFERRDVPIKDQGHTVAPVVIEADAWLGTHVTVLPGVTIGRGAIIAAGSVVNKNVPPYEVWGGVPARFLKERPE